MPIEIAPKLRPNFRKGLEKLKERIEMNISTQVVVVNPINKTKVICKKQYESYCSVLGVSPFPVDVEVACNYLKWLEEV